MTADIASLEALTNLLSEFHSNSVKPCKREEIQNILISFEKCESSWTSALYYIWNTKNQYVSIYCLGIIETVITQKWDVLSKNDQSKIRVFLQEYIVDRIEKDETFLLKKASKILSCIVCLEWPERFTDYLDFIKSHLQNNSGDRKCLIGLFTLQTLIEKFTNPPSNVTHSRKHELQKALTAHSQVIDGILCTFVSRLCEDDLTNLIHLYGTGKLSDEGNLWHSLVFFTESLVSDCLTNCGQKCYAILTYFDCLCEFLKIVNLENVSSDKFLVMIFVFTLIGSPYCLSACVGAEEAMASSNGECRYLEMIGLSALTCVHEFIEKHGVTNLHQLPVVFQLLKCHLNLVTHHIVIDRHNKTLLNSDLFTANSNSDISSALVIDARKQSSCHEYELKLIYIIKCVIPAFLNVFRLKPDLDSNLFDFETFMQLFCEFTFSISTLETYFSCIHVWSDLFESIKFFYFSSSITINTHFLTQNMRTVILNFGKNLFSRLYYSESSSFLDSLDNDNFENSENYFISCDPLNNPLFTLIVNDTQNSNPETEPCEYVIFVRESLLVFQTLVDLFPKDLMGGVLERYQQTLSDYSSLINSVGIATCGEFTIPKGLPVHRIHWILRDFATSLQVVGFLFDKIKHIESPVIGREILHNLLYALNLNVAISPVICKIPERLIRLSFVDVVVQNLLIFRAVLVAGHIGCLPEIGNAPPDKIYLTSEEINTFILEFIRIIGEFIPSLDLGSHFIAPRITCSAGQVFKSLFTSVLPDIRPSSKLILVSNGTNDPKASTVFYTLFNLVFETNNHTSVDYNVLYSLTCAFMCYLSWDEQSVEFKAQKAISEPERNLINQTRHALLNRLATELFLPHLSLAELENDQQKHLIYLSLLNAGVGSLENSTNIARHTIFTILTDSGIMNSLTGCLLHALNNSSKFHQKPELCMKFCTAYLTFFTTFIRILSYSGSTLSAIPQLLGHIIKALRSTLSDASTYQAISSPILEQLMTMILLVASHRKLFGSILPETLDLYIYTFLPVLSNLLNVAYKDELDVVNAFVCNAGLLNGQSMLRFYELFFVILSNHFSFFFIENTTATKTPGPLIPIEQRYTLLNSEVFHRLIRLILAVFHPDQVNSSLVQYVIENLLSLHRLRKLFSLPEFNQTWLCEFICYALNLLIDGKHTSCKDLLIEALYHYGLSFKYPAIQRQISTCELSLFVQYYLPVYLSRTATLNDVQLRDVISSFLVTTSNPDPVINNFDQAQNLRDLNDISVFSQSVDEFIHKLRYYRMVNSDICPGIKSPF